MRFFTLLCCFAAIIVSSPVFAHGSGSSAGMSVKKQKKVPVSVVAKKNFQLALTLEGSEVMLTVKNSDGSAVDVGIASATVFVDTGEKHSWFKLDPSDNEEILKGDCEFIPDENTKFEVTLRLPGERPINASFMPAVSKAPTAMKQ